MLALQTGWTDVTLAALPGPFRAACHWALYVRTLLPDGMPDTAIPSGAAPAERLEMARRIPRILALRKELFPEGDDV